LKNEGVLSDINENEISFNNIILQKSTEVTPDSCETEQIRRSSSGEIRVDAIMTVNGTELFFEPFYSNQIDTDKLNKIKELDVSTIGINLFSFIKKHGSDFTIEILQDYIQNDIKCKEWIYIRKEKLDSLIQNIFNNDFEAKLKVLKSNVLVYNEIKSIIEINMDKINALNKEIILLQQKMPSKSVINLFK